MHLQLHGSATGTRSTRPRHLHCYVERDSVQQRLCRFLCALSQPTALTRRAAARPSLPPLKCPATRPRREIVSPDHGFARVSARRLTRTATRYHRSTATRVGSERLPQVMTEIALTRRSCAATGELAHRRGTAAAQEASRRPVAATRRSPRESRTQPGLCAEGDFDVARYPSFRRDSSQLHST